MKVLWPFFSQLFSYEAVKYCAHTRQSFPPEHSASKCFGDESCLKPHVWTRRGENTGDPPDEKKRRGYNLYVFTRVVCFASLTSKYLEQMHLGFCKPAGRRMMTVMLKGRLFAAQAVIETPPLSRSQAQQIGPTANFLFPSERGTFTAQDSKVRGEVQWAAVGLCNREKGGSNNSSKPPGSHLIHCPGWSFGTTTNKASSYSGLTGFCMAQMPPEIRFRWGDGVSRGFWGKIQWVCFTFLLCFFLLFFYVFMKKKKKPSRCEMK